MPMDGKTQTYGFLDQLSTEQLLDLVRADFDSPEEGNSELMARILEVMEKREKEEPTGLFSDVDQAWEDFQTYYNTPDSEDCPLDPMRDPDITAVEEVPGRPRGKLAKRLSAMAAVVAVSLFSMAAAQAFGLDVFGALARWTEETFHFISGTPEIAGSPESETIRQTMQEVFDRYGVTIPAPAWYPEGTEWARDVKVNESAEIATIITCSFTYGDHAFYIEVHQYQGEERIPIQTFEKDTSNFEEYHSNGKLFYVMSNLTNSSAVYSNSQTVFMIEGTFSLEVLKQIIDSIGA